MQKVLHLLLASLFYRHFVESFDVSLILMPCLDNDLAEEYEEETKNLMELKGFPNFLIPPQVYSKVLEPK